MKDATSELSMTAIAVVAIAAIGVVFTVLIWPQLKASIFNQVKCSSAFNCSCPESGSGICKCDYIDEKTGEATTDQGLTCPYDKVNAAE